MDSLKIQPGKFCGLSDSARIFCGGNSNKMRLCSNIYGSAFVASASAARSISHMYRVGHKETWRFTFVHIFVNY